ncbi:MAG: O-antigen ligase family protein, partial [bacterium]|nr:O-antigen ligase family protein [bacterium]
MAEILFVLFMVSGFAKYYVKLIFGDMVMFDLTLFIVLLLSLLLLKDIFKHFYFKSKIITVKGSMPALSAFLAFFCWMAFTLTYTHSPAYGFTKTFLFLTTFLGFLFPILYRSFNPERFIKYFIYFSTASNMLYLFILPRSFTTQGLTESVKYLDIGYMAALSVLLLLLFPLGLKGWFKLALIVANSASLLISGARGPLLLFLLAMFLKGVRQAPRVLAYIHRLSIRKILVIILALGILTVGLVYAIDAYSKNIERTLYRFSMLGEAASGSSMRVIYINYSLDKMFTDAGHFFTGYGIGSFGIMFNGIDDRMYPHNIFLEVWFEMGFIGVFLLCVFFFYCLRNLRGRNGAMLYVFLYLLLNSMKSYSLIDLRIMFGVLAVLWLYNAHSQRR